MAFLCLLTTPLAYIAFRKEIDDGIIAGRISKPIREAEAKNLPYLQAIIKEALRLYPPAGGHLHKEVPKGGAEVCGYHLPEGVQVGVCLMYVGRDPATFGPDADTFRPERWLEAGRDEVRLKLMNDAVDLVFGHGKFSCLGKALAYMELNKVLVEVSIISSSTRGVESLASNVDLVGETI
jgi:cytochrome P450